MYYGSIKTTDIANGPGVRMTLFVSGCRHRCKGCFQPETWSFRYGEPFTEKTRDEILKSLEPSYIRGFTLLGGEPFEPENQKELVPLLKDVRKYFPQKDIWCFTGYLFEELTGEQTSLLKSKARDLPEEVQEEFPTESSEQVLEDLPADHPRCEVTDEMLSLIDVLVDGEFKQELRDLSLQFRGSSNQRIIRVAESIAAGEMILWNDERSLENQIKKQM